MLARQGDKGVATMRVHPAMGSMLYQLPPLRAIKAFELRPHFLHSCSMNEAGISRQAHICFLMTNFSWKTPWRTSQKLP